MVPFDLLRLHSKANTNACKRYDLHRTPSPLLTGVPSQPHHSTAQHRRHRDLQLQGKTVFDLQTTAAVACVYFSLTKKPGTLLRAHAVMLNWCRNDAFKNHSEFVSFIERELWWSMITYISAHKLAECSIASRSIWQHCKWHTNTVVRFCLPATMGIATIFLHPC